MNIEKFPPDNDKYNEYVKVGDLIKGSNLIYYPSIGNNGPYNPEEWVIKVSTILNTPSFTLELKEGK